jgi:hypothetical protein
MAVGVALTIVGIAVLGATNPGEEPLTSWDGTLARVFAPGALAWFAGLLLGAVLPAVVCVRLRFRGADVAFGIASGFAAAIALVASKLMTAGFAEGEPANTLADNLGRWPFYLFVALMIGGNAASMVYQQLGFQKGKAIVLTPLFTVGTVVVPALTGVVVFDEWARFDAPIVLAKAAAIVVLLAGVTMLSYFSAAAEPAKT